MSEIKGLCAICGKPADYRCKLCGKPVCEKHYDAKGGFCPDHTRGRMLKRAV